MIEVLIVDEFTGRILPVVAIVMGCIKQSKQKKALVLSVKVKRLHLLLCKIILDFIKNLQV